MSDGGEVGGVYSDDRIAFFSSGRLFIFWRGSRAEDKTPFIALVEY